mgnify:CR=1 FL=1
MVYGDKLFQFYSRLTKISIIVSEKSDVLFQFYSRLTGTVVDVSKFAISITFNSIVD